ncbi:MAG TPA: hypothetical protein VNT23_05795 [Gaiellaceae bacterium]|nr:hypothetical protein [Gaiellaceae bacterium]
MAARRAEELLQQAVRLRGIRLGRIVDVIFAPDASRVVGFDVLCGDELHRFLPFSAAGSTEAGELEVTSALLLLDEQELAFYRRHGRTLQQGENLRERLVGVDGSVAENGVAESAAGGAADGRC